MGELVKVTNAVEIAEGELAAFEVGGERIAVANVEARSTLSATRAPTSSARLPTASSRARP
jgi:hypothetical protein